MEEIKGYYQVTGMGCAGCAATVEKVLRGLDGVSAARVNLADATALVTFDPRRLSPDDLKRAVRAAGYDLETARDARPGEEAAYRQLKRKTTGAILLAIPVMVIGMFFMAWAPGPWVMLLLTLPALLFFGRDFFARAYRQLRQRRANMDTLVATSAGVAFLFSLFNTLWPAYWQRSGIEAHVYYEATAVVIALVLLGRLLEARAKSSTTTAIKKLMSLQSRHVTRITAGEEEVEIPVEEARVGDLLLVRPGERVPVDGEVARGASFVDESAITGEPIPVEKLAGDPVYAGSINQKGSFRLRATREEGDTLLARIIRVVREAQGSKAPVQRFVDRVAGIFVPVVMGVAALSFAAWMLAGGESAFAHALLSATSVLVIACPCALGLATPTAIMVGIGKGADHHVLIKDAESLELLHRVDTVVLDKTGTITEGKPAVTEMTWLEAGHEAILSGLERLSEHPLAEAVARAIQAPPRDAGISDFEAIPGQGVTGNAGGASYLVGNRQLLASRGVALPAGEEARCAAREERGETVLFFAGGGRLLAWIAVTDKVKDSSPPAIRRLQARGIATYMLTGDNERTATAVARQVGVTLLSARALPSEKARLIRELQRAGRVVVMVGDGINDSEALVQADVGIAMGRGGADIAIEVAKVTLLTPDLGALDAAFALSRQTLAAIRQNLFWAFIYNVIAIPIAAGALYPVNGFLLNPMIAAGAMAFSSLSVVLNSLRVKRLKI
jgi:Cu2+-exporting ATPase